MTVGELDGDLVLAELAGAARPASPASGPRSSNLAMGPASAKPVHLRLKGDDWDELLAATETVARATSRRRPA